MVFAEMCRQPSLHAAFRGALAANWPGWEIRWAAAGVDDFRRYLGLDPLPGWVSSWQPHRVPVGASGRGVLTTSGRDGVHRFEVDELYAGPELLDRLVPAEDDQPAPEFGTNLDIEEDHCPSKRRRRARRLNVASR